MEEPYLSDDKSWLESPNDVVTGGSKKKMTYQETYEWIKNRTYSTSKHDQGQ